MAHTTVDMKTKAKQDTQKKIIVIEHPNKTLNMKHEISNIRMLSNHTPSSPDQSYLKHKSGGQQEDSRTLPNNFRYLNKY
jgi:hypothetical protein